MANHLTARAVEIAKPGKARREVPDGLVAGLYLVVQPSGAKSWAVRYRFTGRPRKMTLGVFPGVDLAAARKLAQAALVAVQRGEDPGEQKKEAKRATATAELARRDLFENVARDYLEKYALPNTKRATFLATAAYLGFKAEKVEESSAVAKLKKGISNEVTERLVQRPDGGEVLRRWRGRPVQSIARRDVLDLLDELVLRDKTPIKANRVLAAVRGMFNWAVGRDILPKSPCAGLKAPAAETARERVLSDDELRLLWRACDAIGAPFGPMVKVLILTGQRRSEVAGMRRDELDDSKRLWSIPKERVKNGRAHTVPLPDQVFTVLATTPKLGTARNGPVFTSNGETPVSGFGKAKERLDAEIRRLQIVDAEAAGIDPADVMPLSAWTLHDLRRTVASGMARCGIDLPVVEKVLNHVSGSFRGIVSVYQRHGFDEEKRAAIAVWARHVEQIVSGEPGGNVVKLRTAR